jgi:hypothetical protein
MERNYAPEDTPEDQGRGWALRRAQRWRVARSAAAVHQLAGEYYVHPGGRLVESVQEKSLPAGTKKGQKLEWK